MVDWLTVKILILFYKTDFFLIDNVPLWIFKKFQNLEIQLILESSVHRNSAANFRTLGEVRKKLLRLKNAPKLPDFLFCRFLTYHAKFEVSQLLNELSVCAEILRIILSHIYLSFAKVLAKSEMGHVQLKSTCHGMTPLWFWSHSSIMAWSCLKQLLLFFLVGLKLF